MPQGVAKKPVWGLHTAFIPRIFLEETPDPKNIVPNILTGKAAFK